MLCEYSQQHVHKSISPAKSTAPFEKVPKESIILQWIQGFHEWCAQKRICKNCTSRGEPKHGDQSWNQNMEKCGICYTMESITLIKGSYVWGFCSHIWWNIFEQRALARSISDKYTHRSATLIPSRPKCFHDRYRMNVPTGEDGKRGDQLSTISVVAKWKYQCRACRVQDVCTHIWSCITPKLCHIFSSEDRWW